jgi:hypothetical protein
MASEQEAGALFEQGRVAFERHEYEAALEAFEAAVQAGLVGPAAHFNIGVTAFRLGDYKYAENAFREVAQTASMAPLAYYNLGLVAQRRGDSKTAAKWFARAERESDDDRLQELATAQLSAIPVVPERQWTSYGLIGAGYDDNVAFVSDSEVLGVSGVADSFAETQFSLSAPIAEGWQISGAVALLDYLDLDEFDHVSLQGGGRYRLSDHIWKTDVGIQLAYSMLDAEGFDNRRMLALYASRGMPSEWQLSARYRFSDIDGMNDFAGVGGTRHELGARIGRHAGVWHIEFGYELETSDHEDDHLSATRHQLGLGIERELSTVWLFTIDAALRHSRYDEDEQGEEVLADLSFAVTRSWNERWRLVMRYSRADNEADLDDFDYSSNRISASIEALL